MRPEMKYIGDAEHRLDVAIRRSKSVAVHVALTALKRELLAHYGIIVNGVPPKPLSDKEWDDLVDTLAFD